MTRTRVYVGNLDPKATKADISDFFSNCGPIQSIWIAKRPPGFAFIEFENMKDAEYAIDIKNGERFFGRSVRVESSRGGPRGFHSPTRKRYHSRSRSVGRRDQHRSRSRRHRSRRSHSRSRSRGRRDRRSNSRSRSRGRHSRRDRVRSRSRYSYSSYSSDSRSRSPSVKSRSSEKRSQERQREARSRSRSPGKVAADGKVGGEKADKVAIEVGNGEGAGERKEVKLEEGKQDAGEPSEEGVNRDEAGIAKALANEVGEETNDDISKDADMN